MLMLPTALKIYLAIEPVDMRKQFNGLWTLATERLREDPRQGAAFILYRPRFNGHKIRLIRRLKVQEAGSGLASKKWTLI